MSPEQIEGEEADSRADIFAFGAVLYEMVTGRKAFAGRTQASLIGNILNNDPPSISSIVPVTPPALDRLVRRCLAKDREARWQSARDLRDELEWIAHGDATQAATVSTPTPSPWRERAGWIAAAAVAAVAVVLWASTKGPGRTAASTSAGTMRLNIATPPGTDLTDFAISPDGRSLVYKAAIDGQRQLWLRPFDSGAPRPLEGTAGATAPFWAPDSRSIAFFSGGQLRRLDLENGLVRTLAPGATARGGSWGVQNLILFANGSAGSLSTVAASGGDVREVTHVERPRQVGHRYPHFLPDGRHFLYYSLGDRENRGVYLGDVSGGAGRRLIDGDSAAVFLAPDRVLYAREGALWARPLDMTALQLVGEAELISRQVALDGRLFGNVALPETAPGMIAYIGPAPPGSSSSGSIAPDGRSVPRGTQTRRSRRDSNCRPMGERWCFAARSTAIPISGRSISRAICAAG
jgi:hypothetical protein